MDDFNDLLIKIGEVKNESDSRKRKILINTLKSMVGTLEISLKYQKLKDKIDCKIEILESDLLLSFFGSNDITENGKKIKMLKKSLREINLK